MKLFVYGTLEDPQLVVHLLGYEPMSKKMILKGFKRVETGNGKEGFPSLVPAKGESVEGVMYEVTDRNLDILDSWEANYRRVNLKGIYFYLLEPYKRFFGELEN